MKTRSLILLAIVAVACWSGGCARFDKLQKLPGDNHLVREQLVFHTDFELPKNHRLLEELVALRSDVSTRLSLPISDEPINIYLFRTEEEFRTYIHHSFPSFPNRRAFFVETDTRLSVYAFWGDRVAEDLRHETVHGYLHAVLGHLPLWLDEGLAEYFEVSRNRVGLNQPHLEDLLQQLEQKTWTPDLAHLEKLESVADMTQTQYAESWAWVHFLLHSTRSRRELLLHHLHTLRRDARAQPLSKSLANERQPPPQLLIEHLRTFSSAVK